MLLWQSQTKEQMTVTNKGTQLSYDRYTVNREIFVVKIFSWVGPTTKIKHTKFFNNENILTRKFCYTNISRFTVLLL